MDKFPKIPFDMPVPLLKETINLWNLSRLKNRTFNPTELTERDLTREKTAIIIADYQETRDFDSAFPTKEQLAMEYKIRLKKMYKVWEELEAEDGLKTEGGK
jgi:hypothetical protein